MNYNKNNPPFALLVLLVKNIASGQLEYFCIRSSALYVLVDIVLNVDFYANNRSVYKAGCVFKSYLIFELRMNMEVCGLSPVYLPWIFERN